MKDLILIDDATQKQLFDYATANLGLEVDAAASVADLKELIATVYDDDSIEVEIAAKPKRKTAKKAAPVETEPEKICITMAADPAYPTAKAHEVIVNGKSFWVPIGEKCHIPMKYYNALVDAKTEFFPQDDEGKITGDPISTPRFPISVHFGE